MFQSKRNNIDTVNITKPSSHLDHKIYIKKPKILSSYHHHSHNAKYVYQRWYWTDMFRLFRLIVILSLYLMHPLHETVKLLIILISCITFVLLILVEAISFISIVITRNGNNTNHTLSSNTY